MKPVALRFLRFHCLDRHHCAVHYHQLMDSIINRFEQNNPTIKIESVVMRNWYQLMYTLHKKLPTGEGPDIFHTNGGGELEELVGKDLVLDLTEELDQGWRSDFVEATLCPFRFNGREYAVPLEQGFIFVWYNKKIFQKFGLCKPRNFEDLVSICKSLQGTGIVPFAVGNRERWPGAFFFSHLFHRIGGESVFVSDFTKAKNYDVIRDSFIDAAGKVLLLAEAGAFHDECNYMNYQDQRDMFVGQKAAMQLNGNRLFDYLRVEGPELLDDVDIFPFPLVSGGRGHNSTLFGGSLATYGIASTSRHKDEAIAFLKAVTDGVSARDVIHKMGDIPAMKNVPYNEYKSAIHRKMAEELGKAKIIQVHYFKSLPPKPAGVYLNVVSKLLALDISAEQAYELVKKSLVADFS